MNGNGNNHGPPTQAESDEGPSEDTRNGQALLYYGGVFLLSVLETANATLTERRLFTAFLPSVTLEQSIEMARRLKGIWEVLELEQREALRELFNSVVTRHRQQNTLFVAMPGPAPGERPH